MSTWFSVLFLHALSLSLSLRMSFFNFIINIFFGISVYHFSRILHADSISIYYCWLLDHSLLTCGFMGALWLCISIAISIVCADIGIDSYMNASASLRVHRTDARRSAQKKIFQKTNISNLICMSFHFLCVYYTNHETKVRKKKLNQIKTLRS